MPLLPGVFSLVMQMFAQKAARLKSVSHYLIASPFDLMPIDEIIARLVFDLSSALYILRTFKCVRFLVFA